MQDHCLLICNARSLNSFRYHSVVYSGALFHSLQIPGWVTSISLLMYMWS